MISRLDGLHAYAADSWEAWFPDEAPSEFEPAVLWAAHGHVVLFLFPRGSSTPKAVLKAGPTENEVGLLSAEYRTIEQLWPVVPESMRVGMPRPLALEEVDGYTVEALGAVQGRRFSVPPVLGSGSPRARRTLRSFARRAFAWSADLAEVTQSGDGADGSELEARVDRFVDACDEAGLTLPEGRSFARAVGRAGLRWHPTCQQGDPSMRNGLMHRGQLRFVDWGDADVRGQPWSDIAQAPASLAQVAEWQTPHGRRGNGWRVLSTARWVGSLLRDEMERAWRYPLPISWAVTLNAMGRALRSRGTYFRDTPILGASYGAARGVVAP